MALTTGKKYYNFFVSVYAERSTPAGGSFVPKTKYEVYIRIAIHSPIVTDIYW